MTHECFRCLGQRRKTRSIRSLFLLFREIEGFFDDRRQFLQIVQEVFFVRPT